MEKVRRDPASLSRLVKDFDLEVVYKGLDFSIRLTNWSSMPASP